MIASTDSDLTTIPDAVRDLFAETSVFFSAMTKAISQTINPATKQPYSLYDYEAISSVVDGSGLFVRVTEQDVLIKTKSVGATFSKELIESLLGMATGEGELGFAQSMVASIGARGKATISESSSTSENKVANIIFICEYLLGMAMVSAIVVSIDVSKHKSVFKAGPCLKTETVQTSIKMHKETYMFVAPKFISKYAPDLLSVEKDVNYLQFVDYLQDLLEKKPFVTAVENIKTGEEVDQALEAGVTYALTGLFFDTPLPKGQTAGMLKFLSDDSYGGKGEIVWTADEWQPNVITFTVKGTRIDPSPIGLFADDTAKEPFVVSPGAYSIVDPNGPRLSGDVEIQATSDDPGDTLTEGTTYTLKGANFGTPAGKLFFLGDVTKARGVSNVNWSETAITFQVTATAGAEAAPLVLQTNSGGVVSTEQYYTVEKSTAVAPTIDPNDVTDSQGNAISPAGQLSTTAGTTYKLSGSGFGAAGTLSFASNAGTATITATPDKWTGTSVEFTVSGALSSATATSPVKLTTSTGQTATTKTAYTVK